MFIVFIRCLISVQAGSGKYVMSNEKHRIWVTTLPVDSRITKTWFRLFCCANIAIKTLYNEHLKNTVFHTDSCLAWPIFEAGIDILTMFCFSKEWWTKIQYDITVFKLSQTYLPMSATAVDVFCSWKFRCSNIPWFFSLTTSRPCQLRSWGWVHSSLWKQIV